MNLRLVVLIGLLAPMCLLAQKSSSDLQSPQRRQTTVEIAERLARPAVAPALPEDLPEPFNPPGFDLPEGAKPTRSAAPAPAADAGPPVPSAPTGAREVLEMLAAQINPSGTIELRGTPRLIISNKAFETGTRFGVTYNNEDYELELTAINSTTFTLRFRNEEITRPIRPTR